MTRVLGAAFAYFAIAFAAGFLLGVLRVLVVAPHLGATPAIAIELPVMLAISWFACAWLVARGRTPESRPGRIAMGGLAFALLMLAEFCLGVYGFNRTIGEHLGAYREPGAALGLLAQLAFAAFPLIQFRQSA